MKPRRCVVLSAGLLSLAGAVRLPAQVPAAIDFPNDASSAAMGSAGVAQWGRLGTAATNPAAAVTVSDFSLQSVLSSSRGADEAGFALRSSLPLGFAAVYLAYQHKTVTDLIEDPAIDESGFGVFDSSLRLGVARKLGGGFAVGASASLGWSDVFDTEGTSRSFDLGVVTRLTSSFAMGASIRRLGGTLDWSSPGGAASSVDVPMGYRLGATYRSLQVDAVSLHFAGDIEMGSGLGGTDVALGVEADYRDIFVARAGMHSPSAVDAYWSTGFGLRFEGIEAALSYELIDVVGPRLQLQLGVTPSAF